MCEIHLPFGYRNIIYPNDQIVAFKSCPLIIVLDPAFVFKDFSCNGSIQFIHIQVKVPTVLIDLCTAGWFSDGTPMVMILKTRKENEKQADYRDSCYMLIHSCIYEYDHNNIILKSKLNRCMLKNNKC